jgi:hypothetical protein
LASLPAAPEPRSKALVPAAGQQPREARAAPDPTPKVKAPQRLHSPHRVVAAWIEDERRSRERWGAPWGSPKSAEGKALERRRLLILSALFTALERRGHKVETERGAIYQVSLVIEGQTFRYVLSERVSQRRVALSDAELKDPENVSMHRRFRQIREATGHLQLAVTGPFAEKQRWSDDADGLLEDRLSEIVKGLETLGGAAKATKTRRDELERQRLIEERERYEARQRRLRDQNQWRRLRELANRREEAERLRSFIALLRQKAANDGMPSEELAGWLTWAEEWVAAWDPTKGGVAAIMKEVTSVTEWDYRS